MKNLIKKIAIDCEINVRFYKNRLTKKSEQEFLDKVDWEFIAYAYPLSEEFIEKYQDKLSWYDISSCQDLSEEFIEKFQDKVDWSWISSLHHILSEKFIDKFQDKVIWFDISRTQRLSEAFIEKHQDKVNWDRISFYQVLSEAFIEKHQDKVNWFDISSAQKLSEAFIEKHQDKVYWPFIVKFQSLSEEFIEKFLHKMNKIDIAIYQEVSKEFFDKLSLKVSDNCWLYKTKEEKIKYIKENTDYEIIDNDYVILYKAVDSYNRSIYAPNFYTYEVGKEYESKCDCNIKCIDSHGLSAWTQEKALKYYPYGKLLKVKAKIEDIGAIVPFNNKVRCKKFIVIEEVSFIR